MLINRTPYLIIFILCLPFNVYPQKSIKFDKITVDDGLSQSNINWILQDKLGFIWFATNGGLNRFDGSHFKAFLHNDSDTNSISNNIINHIYEDDGGKIWVSTQNGLNVYDQSLEVFTKFKSRPHLPSGLSSNQITCTVKDDFGNYWIGTSGGGLNKYNPVANTFKTFRNISNNPQSISSNYITSIEKDKYGFIWVGTTDNGINMLDTKSELFLRYVKSDNNNKQSISSNQINTIYEDTEGDLWIGTSEGLDLIKTKYHNRNLRNKGEILHFPQILSKNKNVPGNSILSIYQDASGLIWFGTVDNGLGFLNKYTMEAGSFIIDPNSKLSILSNNVNSVFNDRTGILWIGTNAGINIIDKQSDRFTWHNRTPGISNTWSSNNIQSIYKERNGVIWLGTYDKGLTNYDPLTDIYTNYMINDFIVEGESIKERNRVLKKYDKRKTSRKPTPVHYLSNDRIYVLHRDKSKKLWIGTGGGGLNILNINSGRISKYSHNPENPNSISSNIIRSIYEDKKGRVWIGTEDAGLNLFKNGLFKRFYSDENDAFSLSNNDVRSIVEDEYENLWIGTFGGGLNMLDLEKNKFTRYSYQENNQNSLSSNSIYSIHLDKDSNLWIGTADGLNKFDIKKNRFTHFNINNGLASNSIYTILDDNIGNLWLSTSSGISRINKATYAIINYDGEDGLQNTEFNPGAGQFTIRGEMLFGGINGFCSFSPNEISDNQFIPEVIFTEFKILNEKVAIGKPGSPLSKHISETDTVVLSYKDLSLSFEFVAMNFTDSKKNEYAYMLENFEKKWNYIGNRKLANYTSLQPGEYILRVKASNNDGVWNEEGASLYIIIKPPFWQTWWFYSLMVLFIFSAVLLSIQLKTRALNKAKILLEEQVKVRTQQIENQNKILEGANREISNQKNEIVSRNKLLKTKNIEISKAEKKLNKTNEELVSINSNLENIVTERTSSLRKMNDELINSNNELDHFIYRASHDLKGPIARLLGITILAKMDNKDEVLKEYIELIEKGAVDMNKVLNKLNNIHFINRETINREDIEFQKIIKECKANLSNYIENSDLIVNLDVETNFGLKSDPILMKIIIENLLENAVIFKKTKKVQIEVSLRTSRKTIIISVEDNGVGIRKEQKEKIFEMFYRGSERSKGNGLGLYLVRKAVQKLQGKIQIESEEGKYACFTISLPKVIVPKELESLVI